MAENETQLIAGLLLELVNAIAVLGIGVLMVLILGSYNALPIILNEVFMGIWLIVRGFNASAVAPGPARG